MKLQVLFARFLKTLSELSGREIEYPFPDKISELLMRHEKGVCSLDELSSSLNKELGISESSEKWKELLCSIFVGEVQGMREVVLELKERFYLVALSNTCEIHWEFVVGKYPIFNLLDGWVVSYAEKVVKPDPRIFKAAMNRFCDGGKPFYYTDDVEKYVNAAKELGWDAVVFTGAEQCKKEIKSRENF